MHAALLLIALTPAAVSQADAAASDVEFRRPVAVTLSDDGKSLLTANRDSGTVSVLDAGTLVVVDEITVGGRPTDIASLASGWLVVLDEKDHQLLQVAREEGEWQVVARTDVAEYPVRLIVNRDADRCYVSSLWSRTVSVFELPGEDAPAGLQLIKSIALPFEPRELCLIPERNQLIAAGAFDACLAVLDLETLEVSSVRDIPGHNIRGLAIEPKFGRLLIAQQELNPLAHSTRDDVHWGNMMSNLLVAFPLDKVCDPSAHLLKHRWASQLGEPGHAAADPGGIHIAPGGEIVVLLSGVGEVALVEPQYLETLRRVPVGQRPVSATASMDGRLFVANMFSDSLSVLDLKDVEESGQVALGPQPEPDLVRRGEMLFFDARLSLEGWMSCHSCHTDGHSNAQLNDNLSDGSFGAPKRVLSLLGVGDTAPFGWNGGVARLEEQVANSVEKTMQGKTPDQQQVAALVAFMKTLVPPRLAARNYDQAAIERGEQLFSSLGCAQCHAPPRYTTPVTYIVGLTDSLGNNRFNPPSLLGVGSRRPLLHDGRAASLEEVFTKYRHQVDRELTDEELAALISYLTQLGNRRT